MKFCLSPSTPSSPNPQNCVLKGGNIRMIFTVSRFFILSALSCGTLDRSRQITEQLPGSEKCLSSLSLSAMSAGWRLSIYFSRSPFLRFIVFRCPVDFFEESNAEFSSKSQWPRQSWRISTLKMDSFTNVIWRSITLCLGKRSGFEKCYPRSPVQ